MIVMLMLLCWVAATGSAAVMVPLEGSVMSLHVAVDPTVPRSATVPSDFASFSVEVPCARSFITAPNSSYLNLLRYLANTSGGQRGPNLRIGGNSADLTWYATAEAPCPHSSSICINDTDVMSFTQAKYWKGSVTIGTSLQREYEPANAVNYSLACLNIIPHELIDGFEIGNEPDLFSKNGLRSPNYTFTGYKKDFQRVVAALRAAAFPFPWVQGAVTCCDWWDELLESYVKDFTSNPSVDSSSSSSSSENVLTSMSQHFYPMSSASATVEKLLAPDAAQGVLKSSTVVAQATVANGIPFYIGEGNSAYDGGAEGVSDTVASALWAVDMLFHAATGNISRFNFHGCPLHSAYTPIANDPTYGYAKPRPLYYGMLAFTEAASYGSHIVMSETSSAMKSMNIQSWSTVTESHPNGTRLSVVLLQKNASAGVGRQQVSVSVGDRFARSLGKVTVIAPMSGSVAATANITYGGLSFDDSTDGRPSGVRVYQEVTVDADGVFTVSVLPASITLVEVFSPRK